MEKKDIQSGEGTRLTVAEVLAHYGMTEAVPRSGFIPSPFRSERTASFHILPHGYAWTDFGDGSRGGVMELVMRLEGCEREAAIEKLREIRACEAASQHFQRPYGQSKPSRQSSFKVISVSQLQDETLLAYSQSRGISEATIQRFCSEVSVRTGGKVKTYIGFQNNAEGFVLRSPEKGKSGKRCTSSAPTYLNAGGVNCTEPSSDSVTVFEGFFDFLSFMELTSDSSLRPKQDICVLNSVVNAQAAADFIRSHQTVHLYLDNDEAGRRTSREITNNILAANQEAIITDHNEEYKDFNDLNEWLQNSVQKEIATEI
jgi:DNA primase